MVVVLGEVGLGGLCKYVYAEVGALARDVTFALKFSDVEGNVEGRLVG